MTCANTNRQPMRERWVIDRRTGKVVSAKDYVPPERERGPIVVKDIEPYRSIIDNSVIGGRKQHRDHLRAHGCFEIGTEKMNYGNRDKPLPPAEDSVRQAIKMIREGYRGE